MSKLYPLWKMEYIEEEIYNKRYNSYNIYVKPYKESNWQKLYSNSVLGKSITAFNRLKDLWDTKICKLLQGYEPAMFEYAGQIYKTISVDIKSSYISGEQIIGNDRYGEVYPDGVKYNYVDDYIFFYDKNVLLVKNNQLFLNGELLANAQQLYNLCSEIGQEFNQLDSYPDKLIDYYRDIYPDIRAYECNVLSQYF